MVTQILVRIHDRLHESAQRLAVLTGHDVEDILAALLELSLSPFIPQLDLAQPIETMSDETVLALTGLQMQPEQDRRLSVLLQQQQNNLLSDTERQELQALMRVYEIGMIYKSQALAEAVKRRLREPLTT